MTKKISIEFRYVDRNACSRCKKTSENTARTYAKLKNELKKIGVEVSFKARKLPLSKLKQSNSVLINGRDLKMILDEKDKSSKSRCYGCSRIMRKPCVCRSYSYRGKRYQHITATMIKEAIGRILRVELKRSYPLS